VEIASFVISLVALGIGLLSLPTIFQMYWGAPIITLETNKSHKEDWHVLRIYVQQPMVENKLMRRLGVLRQPTDVTVRYEVIENPTGRLVLESQFPKLKTDKEYGRLVTLSGFFPAIFSVATKNGSEAFLISHDDENGNNIPLDAGRYNVVITAIYAMHKKKEKAFSFTVSRDCSYFAWD
jgi:hypothetical protein